MPTPAADRPVVFTHDGHRFECYPEFFVYEGLKPGELIAEARWVILFDGRHGAVYEMRVRESAEDIRTRLIHVYNLQRQLGVR